MATKSLAGQILYEAKADDGAAATKKKKRKNAASAPRDLVAPLTNRDLELYLSAAGIGAAKAARLERALDELDVNFVPTKESVLWQRYLRMRHSVHALLEMQDLVSQQAYQAAVLAKHGALLTAELEREKKRRKTSL